MAFGGTLLRIPAVDLDRADIRIGASLRAICMQSLLRCICSDQDGCNLEHQSSCDRQPQAVTDTAADGARLQTSMCFDVIVIVHIFHSMATTTEHIFKSFILACRACLLACLLACLNSFLQRHVYILADKSARGAIGAINRDIWRSQMQPHTQTLTIWRSQMQPHIH